MFLWRPLRACRRHVLTILFLSFSLVSLYPGVAIASLIIDEDPYDTTGMRLQLVWQKPASEVVAGVEVMAGEPTASEPNGGAARYAGLRQSIESVLAEVNGEWGIGVMDLASGESLSINAGRAYPAASQYKLLVFYEAYRRIDAGTLSLDQVTRMVESDYADSLLWDEELKPGDRVSVKGLLRVMVIQSSNAAAHALERVMGVAPAPTVNGAAAQLGLGQTHMPVPGDRARFNDWRAEQAGTSVVDLMLFYELLYRGQMISKSASQAMLDLLKEQQINDRIPALLPRDVAVAHKTGNLPGVVNDAGIIFGPRSDVILVVLNDGADYEPGTAAITKIGQLVYSYHNR